MGPPESKASGGTAHALASAYVSAYQAKDVAQYLSLFSKDADYVDYGVQVHKKIRQLKEELQLSFQRDEFDLEFHSFFVSVDERFAALMGSYSDTERRGRDISVPIVSILEFHNGEIVKESLYYDGSEFKRHFMGA
jgi:ketosteroid isomerase-like protein